VGVVDTSTQGKEAVLFLKKNQKTFALVAAEKTFLT